MSFNNNATNLFPNAPYSNDLYQFNQPYNSLNGWNMYGATAPTFCWNNFNGN